jgi:hypothetical protein
VRGQVVEQRKRGVDCERLALGCELVAFQAMTEATVGIPVRLEGMRYRGDVGCAVQVDLGEAQLDDPDVCQ